ncbi:MAG: sulfite exporter TauE/SafE family protein, partial [Ferruginibacter sp.]
MDIQTILIIIVIGIAAGVLSGLIGVGGGIIIVPALVLLIGFTQKEAQGTSLGVLLLPVGILGVLQYYKQGHIDIKVVGYLSLGFIVGGYFGSKIAMNISQEAVKKIFAIVMIIISIKMIFFDKAKKNNVVPNSKTSSITNIESSR